MRYKNSLDEPEGRGWHQRQTDLIGWSHFKSSAIVFQVPSMRHKQKFVSTDIQNSAHSEACAFHPATRQAIAHFLLRRRLDNNLWASCKERIRERGHLTT